ncbi:cyclopropane-fatty-acyl-phospholipid synthase [Marinobacterium zhoushanense]|uniref:Cyclopropane-fatty-acyl-phospholipid synthase n=1 Tax=Marinobacterium zhoushanense TaxID=1679163 RepID=A0ABQ1JZV7_9GAMM|nr:cyclopropane fatty acyl phospholipid synthase [Marinobacterium zhoushanense]GGB78854.1 cyclopropane-fatty-acyl-phospholipid synthase [Marinobacterium zhoushanense]
MQKDSRLGLSEEFDTARTAPPKAIVDLLAMADVRINGDRPWDIQVIDDRLYSEVLTRGTLGFGEAYMDRLWECHDLSGLMARVMSERLDEKPLGRAKLFFALYYLRARIMNLQTSSRAFQVGEQHYDIGNDLYAAMLDPHWCYSCGYWREAEDLDAAQVAKLDLICRKLQLEPGMKVLEVGCGWGSLAGYMAEHYSVEIRGITISKEQARMARQRCEGLPVEIDLVDYRDVQGQYDRVVSVGMFEHVGRKNYADYFSKLAGCVKPDGLFLLHTIGTDNERCGVDPWIDRYIFPNGELPTLKHMIGTCEQQFHVEDLHSFGTDYDKTLMAWWNNFQGAWPQLSERYDERFYRMWRYYLMSCAGFFRAKRGQLWQLVLSPLGSQRVYRSVR